MLSSILIYQSGAALGLHHKPEDGQAFNHNGSTRGKYSAQSTRVAPAAARSGAQLVLQLQIMDMFRIGTHASTSYVGPQFSGVSPPFLSSM